MLTREQVLAEPAGFRLDEWVAEYVMGWKRGNPKRGEHAWKAPTADPRYGGYREVPNCPRYSADIGAAWDVVDAMYRRLSGRIDLTRLRHDLWVVTIGGLGSPPAWGEVKATADTAPLAVCRAALLTTLSEER